MQHQRADRGAMPVFRLGSARIDTETVRAAFDITDEDVDAMKLTWRLVDPDFENIIERFYANPFVSAHVSLFHSADRGRLKAKQYEHWKNLFNSNFDDEYMRRVRRAAIAHRMLGVQASTYVLSYRIFMNEVVEELRRGFSLHGDVLARIIIAFGKFVSADIAVTVHAYESELVLE